MTYRQFDILTKMKLNSIFKFALPLVWLIIAPLNAFSAAETAADIMKIASGNLKAAKGVNCKFTMSSNQGNISGTLKASGPKFALTTAAASTWYDGKDMWTYNSSTNETTLVTPTAAELRESNPLEYIKQYYSEYTPTFSNTKKTGKYIITLTPKKKSNEVKTLDVTLNAKSFKPEVISIVLKSGAKSVITINSIDYNYVFKASDFEYQKSKFPKAQIVDLR